MTDGPQAVPAIDVEISTDGDFPDVADCARTKLGKLARLTHVPVSRARLRLSRHRDPVVDHPVIARGRLDVGNGKGIPPDNRRSSGLRNLARRAESAHGQFTVADRPGGGTEVVWSVPLTME